MNRRPPTAAPRALTAARPLPAGRARGCPHGLFIGALWTTLSACGGPAPPPLAALHLDQVSATTGDAAQGLVALRDRRRWRAGIACADCHRVPGDADPRPAPPIVAPERGDGPWWHQASPTLSGAIARCAERFGATPADASLPLADLLAALNGQGAHRAPTATTTSSPAEDWRRLCAHCHDQGLGPALHDRPWPPTRFIAAVRHTDRALHPGSQMPGFEPGLIDDARLAALAAALEAGSLRAR